MLKPTVRTMLARPGLASEGPGHGQEGMRRLSGVQYLNQTRRVETWQRSKRDRAQWAAEGTGPAGRNDLSGTYRPKTSFLPRHLQAQPLSIQ